MTKQKTKDDIKGMGGRVYLAQHYDGSKSTYTMWIDDQQAPGQGISVPKQLPATLSSTERHVLLTLVTRCSDKNPHSTFAGEEHIQKVTGLTRWPVSKAIVSLEAKQLIRRKSRGRKKTKITIFNWDRIVANQFPVEEWVDESAFIERWDGLEAPKTEAQDVSIGESEQEDLTDLEFVSEPKQSTIARKRELLQFEDHNEAPAVAPPAPAPVVTSVVATVVPAAKTVPELITVLRELIPPPADRKKDTLRGTPKQLSVNLEAYEQMLLDEGPKPDELIAAVRWVFQVAATNPEAATLHDYITKYNFPVKAISHKLKEILFLYRHRNEAKSTSKPNSPAATTKSSWGPPPEHVLRKEIDEYRAYKEAVENAATDEERRRLKSEYEAKRDAANGKSAQPAATKSSWGPPPYEVRRKEIDEYRAKRAAQQELPKSPWQPPPDDELRRMSEEYLAEETAKKAALEAEVQSAPAQQ